MSNDVSVQCLYDIFRANGEKINMNISAAMRILATSQNTENWQQYLEAFGFYFNSYYDQLKETTDPKKLSVLSDLATVFIDEENYTGDYNKVCYLIREELKKIRR